MTKLKGALTAFEKGQTNVMASKLRAFINELNAQAGKGLPAAEAEAMAMEAAEVVFTLPDPEVAARVAYWADIVAPIVNEPVVISNIELDP